MEEWKIKIIDVGYRITRQIFIFRRCRGYSEFMQNDGTLKTVEEGSAEIPKPTLELEPEALQALADELAQVGYKPLKGFVEGKLEATEKHLDDMRKIVFEPTITGNVSLSQSKVE